MWLKISNSHVTSLLRVNVYYIHSVDVDEFLGFSLYYFHLLLFFI